EDASAVQKFLLQNYQKVEEKVLQPSDKPVRSEPTAVINPINYSMPVYAADILASLQIIFTHDIALKKEIKGLELDALKEFLTVLSKYLDLGRQYNEEIAYLQRTVAGRSIISREEWTEFVAKMKLSTDEVNYIACRGSRPYLRGYPCGLWVMFHSMTVNRFLKNEKPDDKAPIAHALNRFVSRFFSCGYCAFHFAKMTSNVRLPGEAIYPDRPDVKPPFPLVEPDLSTLPIPPKSARDEVLWLNNAHNRVNKRLSGESSEDPAAPKVCRACWSDEARAKMAEDKFAAHPDRTDELLAYLVHHYRPSSWRWDDVCVSFEDISQ
ncbi:unnamed protein product, partial [Hymenolepis diminuta]|uniref:Sulfhydryl oxidase n=1 Tax=Hymenolepis diminuta TaxID=6216 RepID=A0A158QEX4_HYMDI